MAKRLVLIVCALFALAVTTSADDHILLFHTMTPVVRPFLATANPIRGVNGGGIPWLLTSAHGSLTVDGRIDVRVRGLVLAEGPNAGMNPIPNFKAIVSCLTPTTESGTLVVATVNRSTSAFPASVTGDADIEDMVSLPTPCVAPIIFVTSPTGAWFAATGF